MVSLPPDYQILPATWRDIRDMYRLEKIVFPLDAWPFLDVVVVLTFPNIVRLKAVHLGEFVGFITGERKIFSSLGWIASFAVDPAHQGRGLGSAMLQRFEAEINTTKIRLSVRPSNDHALRLYERFDYLPVGNWPRYYRGGEDALILEKTLP